MVVINRVLQVEVNVAIFYYIIIIIIFFLKEYETFVVFN